MAEHYNDHWSHRAACKDADPEIFHPIGHTSDDDRNRIWEAKAVCRVCEVRQECLDEALQDGLKGGVWGGLTEPERERAETAQAFSGSGTTGLAAARHGRRYIGNRPFPPNTSTTRSAPGSGRWRCLEETS